MYTGSLSPSWTHHPDKEPHQNECATLRVAMRASGGTGMDLKRIGVWAALDGFSAADAAQLAQQVEKWGYGALWIPEAVGREVFSSAAWLLACANRRGSASPISRRAA